MCLDISTWELTFQELIQQEKSWAKWTLKLDENIRPDRVAPRWKQFQQRAFGRFLCSSCQRSWASAQVKILCHMYWEHQKSQGQVLMRIFAQRCQKCSWSQFEKLEFSEDNIMSILHNLVQYILERYYGHNFRKMPMIREIPLDGPHDKVNCEACTLGFCVRGSRRCIVTPSELPSSFLKSQDSLPRYGDVLGVRGSQRHLVKPSKSLPSSLEIQHSSPRYGDVLGYDQPTERGNPGEFLFIIFMILFVFICSQCIKLK